jgi:hypothetical protein
MSVNKSLLTPLICSKYIFHKGIDILEKGGPFSSGLAVLHFQDSVEMVLRAIAEHLHCTLKDNVTTPGNDDYGRSIDNGSTQTQYDNEGREESHESSFNGLPKIKWRYKYINDSHGNWIKKISVDDSDIEKTEEIRIIEYY